MKLSTGKSALCCTSKNSSFFFFILLTLFGRNLPCWLEFRKAYCWGLLLSPYLSIREYVSGCFSYNGSLNRFSRLKKRASLLSSNDFDFYVQSRETWSTAGAFRSCRRLSGLRGFLSLTLKTVLNFRASRESGKPHRPQSWRLPRLLRCSCRAEC